METNPPPPQKKKKKWDTSILFNLHSVLLHKDIFFKKMSTTQTFTSNTEEHLHPMEPEEEEVRKS